MKKASATMAKGFTVSDLPKSERPRERLAKYGPEGISQQELLAVIIGRGVKGQSVMVLAQELVTRFKGLHGIARASVEQLQEIRGVGPAKAAQVKAACELARRLLIADDGAKPRKALAGAEDVYQEILPDVRGKQQEYFFVLLLDSRSQLIRCEEISKGSLSSTVVHPREAFKEAIAASAAAVIFVHNHPSGDPEPSDDDINLTKRLVSVGQVMGIPVHDHVIVTDGGFVSMRARNLI